MYKKKESRFENYWLASTETNLKFFPRSHHFLLSNNRVYTQHNAWIFCGDIIDSALRRQSEKEALLKKEAVREIRRFSVQLYDLFKNLMSYRLHEYPARKGGNIYHDGFNASDNMIPMLARINERARARNEAAGITFSRPEIGMPDDAVKIALRAARKNRK